jgi:RNA polymerase sigma-70 factor (ECF subfamily)
MNQNRTAKSAQLDDPASWVDLYGDLLYRFALSRVKDPSIAEELVQETLLAALKSRANFQGRSTARTWLIAILKHKIVDHIRKRVREPAFDKVESLSDALANDPVEGNFKDDDIRSPLDVQILQTIQRSNADIEICPAAGEFTRRRCGPIAVNA